MQSIFVQNFNQVIDFVTVLRNVEHLPVESTSVTFLYIFIDIIIFNIAH